MPEVKTVAVHYERKFNLGDYNSAAIGINIWADVEEGEELHEVMDGLWSMAKENVKAQALPLINNGKAEVKEIFMGLPKELQSKIADPAMLPED